MNFETAVKILTSPEIEGGYSNHTRDPGGETKFGISKRAYPHLDIKNLTLEEAKEIYLKDYWNRCRCQELPQKIRLMVFDGAVNHGAAASIGLLQVAVGATVDGVIGEETIKKAWGYPEELIAEKIAILRRQRYFADRNFPVFGAGWITRLIKISMRTIQE